jgi:hypothetical protein
LTVTFFRRGATSLAANPLISGPRQVGSTNAFHNAGGDRSMPRKGDVNKKFGVYRNLCCGAEIVIPENVTFPGCAEHIHPDTQWKLLSTDAALVSDLIQNRRTSSASPGGPGD